METYTLHYGHGSRTTCEETGDIFCLAEGRLCLFTLLRSSNPNPSEDKTREIFCRDLMVEEVSSKIFYQLNSYCDVVSGKYFLLPRATRYYFKFDIEGFVIEESALSFSLSEKSELVKEVSRRLYIVDVVAKLRQVL